MKKLYNSDLDEEKASGEYVRGCKEKQGFPGF